MTKTVDPTAGGLLVPHRDLRRNFHDALDELRGCLSTLVSLVAEDIVTVNVALCSSDTARAASVVEREPMLDSYAAALERTLPGYFACQQPVARDLRLLITAMRVLPELERSRDLVRHVAERTGMLEDVTDPVRAAICEMGCIAGELWQRLAEAFDACDPACAKQLQERDNELDGLAASLAPRVQDGHISREMVLEIALLGRFYERLGDHAVNLASHVCYLVTGVSATKPRF